MAWADPTLRYPNPHWPLWRFDEEGVDLSMPPEFDAMRRNDFRVWHTSAGWFARRRNKLVMPPEATAALRLRLAREQDGLCAYCKEPMRLREYEAGAKAKGLDATIEHRQPLSRGGTWKRKNLCACCATCNTAKGDLDDAEFQVALERFPPGDDPKWATRVRSFSKNLVRDRALARHQEANPDWRYRNKRDRRRERRASLGPNGSSPNMSGSAA